MYFVYLQEDGSNLTNPIDDVEYAELVFSNGKAKEKKSKSKKKVKIKKQFDDSTTYACIDHVKTAQQYQQKQMKEQKLQQKNQKQQKHSANDDGCGDEMKETAPLMEGGIGLESSV